MPRFPVTWPFLRRRGWLLLLGPVLGIAIAWALSGITVSATSALSVRTVGPYQPPYQQQRLALTYAQLLPEEPALIAAVSRATDLPRGDVRDQLTMSALPQTNILIARFSAASAGVASTGLRALAAALPSASDSAGTSLRRTVRPLTTPTVDSGMSRRRGLLIGALGGLAIALALALTLERRRPRVDYPRDLAGLLSVPVSQVGARSIPNAFSSSIVMRRGRGVELRPVDQTLPAHVFGGAKKRVLVVGRGTAVTEVEEAVRAGATLGTPVAAALFVNPSSSAGSHP